MRGRFNYLLFFLRIMFSILLFAGGIWLTILIVQEVIDSFPGIGEVGLSVIRIVLIFYMGWRLGLSAWTQRFTITIADGHVIVRDVLLFKRRVLQLADIKGFSLMEYPTKWVMGKSIILYLSAEEKLEFPQFLFFNFWKLDRALEESGLYFFGVESREWRWRKLE